MEEGILYRAAEKRLLEGRLMSDGIELTRPTREERRADAALDNLNGAVGIRNGKQVSNFAIDQNLVISYLNKIPTESGGTLSRSGPTHFKATRNGFCDVSLFEAILRFQQTNGLTADGVADMGGPTLRALKTIAARGHAAAPTTQNKEQDYINKVFGLIDILKVLVNQRPTILSSSQLSETRAILSNLERLMAKSGAKRTSQPDVRNNAAVAVGIVVVVIGAAILILALAQDPTWRKAAQVMSDGIVREIDSGIRRMNQLMQSAKDKAVQTLIDGVVAINQKAFELSEKKRICKPVFLDFERIATQVTFDLTHRPALAARALKAFIDALLLLLKCLGLDAAPILVLLRRGVEAGETLFDLIVKASGGGFVLLPNLGQ
jgi:hypothetical protein